MPRRPNYGQDRAERQRSQAAKRDKRLAAKAERRGKGLSDPESTAAAATVAPAAVAERGVPMPVDPVTLVRLSQALKFVCGAEHPATLAVLRAARSGAGDDIQRAHALFQQLTPGNRRAALTLSAATQSALR